MSAPSAPASFAPLPAIQNDGGAREFLMSYHWPVPLQEVFIENLHHTPLRYFICDDSGSMGAVDGQKLVKNGENYQ
jgi:hypothetical protein